MKIFTLHRKIAKDNAARVGDGKERMPHYSREVWIKPGETKQEAQERRQKRVANA